MSFTITRHAMDRLSERYNLSWRDIDMAEMYGLLRKGYKASMQLSKDVSAVPIIYRGQLIKAVYNHDKKVLITVKPLVNGKTLKLDRTNLISRR